jgi:hypothetical protein
MNLGEHIKKIGLDKLFASKVDDDLEKDALETKQASKAKPLSEASSNSMFDSLTGAKSTLGEFWFPPDLIGGTCPYIAGNEEEIVWNAAAEACDSERVHVVWQASGNRIWYLAIRSSDMASQPNSWCPLASLLPTMKGAAPSPVLYTYYGDEIAVLMIVTLDGLQVFRGTGPVVRAKSERTARELDNAEIVNLDPDRIEDLDRVPWYSVSLFEDRARRILATLSVLASIGVAAVSFLVWLTASMSSVAARHELTEARQRTETKTMQLLQSAEITRTSPLRDQIEKFLSLNDGLLSLNGFLNVYEIKDGSTRWRAVVPPSATADRITAIGGKSIEATPRGVAIGNDAEIQYEAKKGQP